jgi:isopenicillin N synthase-like dioxygenase
VRLPATLCGPEMDNLLKLSKKFFKLPQEEKEKACEKNNFGYSSVRLQTRSFHSQITKKYFLILF